ncbi:hypothetical protein GCM10010168_35280 [Actinoplanes ianthinogenes]|uniref:Ferric siderophore reductase C-terminal domain-containing protein n=1 Tax=Actinoplanes ianthinogenes TaxID=122358 RepID=A0ABN6CRZ7_9ACTN|nr:(2Fe-2S)-binding protein [Actinoplanes ianthinogenes]BCJ46952.1 hypothetical protein Aiant_76090 [Actinoplanes ianthinogenes]GGR14407.1 hypothetical protein GCM10010168_35280 [Actinoplanes ianthinogenes]
MTEALTAAARLGPYFAWTPWDGSARWRPFRELLDPRVVAERVELGRDTLARMSGLDRGAIGERAVASITFLGLASRLLSPLLGAATIGGAIPRADPGQLWWQPVTGGPLPIAYRDLTAEPCAGWEPRRIAEAGLLDLVEPLLTVFRERYSLSPQVLWGNVASALGGAAGMIADAPSPATGMIADGQPSPAARSAAIVEAALDLAPLRRSADLVRPDPRRDRWFLVRRNCCLYYRIPGGGTCGDCVLTPEAERHRTWRAVLSR